MTRPKLIASAGMIRSGSTWQYNILRALLLAEDLDLYSCWVGDYDPNDPRSVHLVKMHDVASIPLNNDAVVFTSYRDIRAVIGSLLRMKWLNEDPMEIVSTCDWYVQTFARNAARSDYSMRYELSLSDPHSVARAMADTLSLSNSASVVKALTDVENLVAPGELPTGDRASYDHTTGLHAGHIGERSDQAAISRLQPESISAIEASFGRWLQEMKYLPQDNFQ